MLVSLGYSCQTQFSIDAVSFDFLRRPFDFNITSLHGLILALETEGKSLRHRIKDLSIHTMPKERRQGLEFNGVYFWHDYPVGSDRLSLAGNWRDSVANINAKYARLWPRFAVLLRSEQPKTIVVSNSQSNLDEFSIDTADFYAKFGLGPSAYTKIKQALTDFGTRNFSLKFLTRSLLDIESCQNEIDDPYFEIQFVGILSLPYNSMVAASLCSVPNVDIAQTCGSFDGGQKAVKQTSGRSALIYRHDRGAGDILWGSITAMSDGYLASFSGQDKSFKAVIESGNLYFSNRTKWIRDRHA